MIDTKTCKTCGESRPVADFYKHSKTKDGLHVECRFCATTRATKNHNKWKAGMGKEVWSKKVRTYSLKRKFGLSQEAYDEMFKAQDGRCAICGEIPDSTLHVDHDHATKEIRGLLCRGCNTGLGNFKDSPDLLLKAMKYLI